jgi:hypothetical protein
LPNDPITPEIEQRIVRRIREMRAAQSGHRGRPLPGLRPRWGCHSGRN